MGKTDAGLGAVGAGAHRVGLRVLDRDVGGRGRAGHLGGDFAGHLGAVGGYDLGRIGLGEEILDDDGAAVGEGHDEIGTVLGEFRFGKGFPFRKNQRPAIGGLHGEVSGGLIGVTVHRRVLSVSVARAQRPRRDRAPNEGLSGRANLLLLLLLTKGYARFSRQVNGTGAMAPERAPKIAFGRRPLLENPYNYL